MINIKKTQVAETVQFELMYRNHNLSFKDMPGAMSDQPTLVCREADQEFVQEYVQECIDANMFDAQLPDINATIGNSMRQIKEHLEINTRIFCYLTNFKYSTMSDVITHCADTYNAIVATPAFMQFISDKFSKNAWDIRNASLQIRETLNEVMMEFITAFERDPLAVLRSILNIGNFGPIETKINKMHKTPSILVQEIVDAIPNAVFQQSTSTFYDPCCGTGTFLFAVVERLQKYHSLEHIITNMIFGNDIDPKYTFLVKCQMEALCLSQTARIISFNNLTNKDFLGVDMDRKFDVVIGNPPYQDAGKKGDKLWVNFVEKSLAISSEIGYVAMVTPDTFVHRSGNTFKTMINEINKYTLTYLDMTATKHFNVGQTICAYVIDKSISSKQMILKYVEDSHECNDTVEFSTIENIVVGKSGKTHKSIIKKILSLNLPSLPLREDVNNSQKALITSGKLSETQTEIYKYPIVYTAAKTHYAKELFGDKDAWKVMMTISGYYYHSVYADKYMRVTTDMSGQGMCHILADNEAHAHRLRSFLSSTLYQYFVISQKTSGFNTQIRHLPMLDDKMWDDDEIYALFGITNDEITYINTIVK